MTQTLEKQHCLGYLDIGDCDLFGAWDLVIEI
jgi:hypothetical protein